MNEDMLSLGLGPNIDTMDTDLNRDLGPSCWYAGFATSYSQADQNQWPISEANPLIFGSSKISWQSTPAPVEIPGFTSGESSRSSTLYSLQNNNAFEDGSTVS